MKRLNIKNFKLSFHCSPETKASWWMFGLFFVCLFFKGLFFHAVTFHSFVPFAYIASKQVVFYSFWLPKFVFPLFMASFVFLQRNKWWTIIVCVIADLWIMSNVLYYNANSLFISWDSMWMAGNLKGFESSVTTYMNWSMLAYPISTIVYAAAIYLSKLSTKRNIRLFVYSFIVVTALHIGMSTAVFERYHRMDMGSRIVWIDTSVPFYNTKKVRQVYWSWDGACDAIQYGNIISHFPKMVIGGVVDEIAKLIKKEDYSLTPDEQKVLDKIYIEPNDTVAPIVPKYSLLILLVESLEDWTIGLQQTNGKYFLPTFTEIAQKGRYCSSLKSQQRHGVSADGQMMLMSGLMPIADGAAAISYGKNVYPNYAHFYPKSCIIEGVNAWNQPVMTKSYNFKQLIAADWTINEKWTDDRCLQYLDTTADLQCQMVLTIASHTPFDRVPENKSLRFPAGMPDRLRDYLTCLHYTDSCFGAWYEKWQTTEAAQNTIVLITGDHRVFSIKEVEGWQAYAKKAHLRFGEHANTVPFIMLIPNDTTPMFVDEPAYQMDMYPTIMATLGVSDYSWKGFGVNLWDEEARANRSIDEKIAYRISNKLIRSNYFRTHPLKP